MVIAAAASASLLRAVDLSSVEIGGNAVGSLIADVVLVDLVVVEVIEGVVDKLSSGSNVVAVSDWNFTRN